MISFTAFFHLTSSLLNDPNLDNIVTKAVFECDHKAAFGIAVVAQNRNSSGIDNNFNFVKAYGYQNISAKKLANSQTLFCIGSLTKHITATLVLHLLHELRLRGSRWAMIAILFQQTSWSRRNIAQNVLGVVKSRFSIGSPVTVCACTTPFISLAVKKEWFTKKLGSTWISPFLSEFCSAVWEAPTLEENSNLRTCWITSH